MADYIFLTLAIALNIVGIIGCFIPMIPGPPISFLGLLTIYCITDDHISPWALSFYGIITIITVILDYVIPSLGVKYFGGTKYGKWGSFIGTIIGLAYFPIGLLLGPFLGAFIGELIGRQDRTLAFRSGVGSMLGFIFGVLMKFIVCIYFLFITVASVWDIMVS
ncbi:MAG: DUF456 domain-containing protein [Clostridiales bacterium]|nr:DUF456 domain-containing protein [Clostridiales bacterium]